MKDVNWLILTYLLATQKIEVCLVYPLPLAFGPCNLPYWVMSPTSRYQLYLQMIVIKLHSLWKCILYLLWWMLQVTNSEELLLCYWVNLWYQNLQTPKKANPKFNFFFEKMKLLCNFRYYYLKLKKWTKISYMFFYIT